MIIIGIGLAAFLALRAYQAMVATDPEGTKGKVDVLFQGAEMIRILAVFATSFFYVIRGTFRPVGLVARGGTARLPFGGQTASDAD